MKRFLFAGLFVCALCLVNVANAGYEWTTQAPVAPEGKILGWTTVEFKVEKDESNVYVVTTVGDAAPGELNVGNVAVQNYEDKLSILINTYFLSSAGNDYFSFTLTQPESASGKVFTTVVGKDPEPGSPWNASITSYLTVADDVISQLIVNPTPSTYNGNGPFQFKVAFASLRDDTAPQPYPTPEPASMLIFGLGLAGLGLCRRMRKI